MSKRCHHLTMLPHLLMERVILRIHPKLATLHRAIPHRVTHHRATHHRAAHCRATHHKNIICKPFHHKLINPKYNLRLFNPIQ